MRERVARRRGRTRWLLVASVVAIALVMIGTEVLLQLAPQAEVEADAFAVEGVPPLAIEEVRRCLRGDQPTIGEIRSSLTIEGRVSSSQIYACPSAYDGARVTYVGEAVGEILRRDGGAWVQVNDDPYALETGPVHGHRDLGGFNTGVAVWLPDDLHEEIDALGRHGRRGEVVSVIGIVHRADPADGGGLTIRAEAIEILAPSVVAYEPLHRIQAIVAAVLAALAAASLLWARRSRQR